MTASQYSGALSCVRLTTAAKDVARALFALGPEAVEPRSFISVGAQVRRMLSLACNRSKGRVHEALDELECAGIIRRSDGGAPGTGERVEFVPPFAAVRGPVAAIGGEVEWRFAWTATRASVLYASDMAVWRSCAGALPCQRAARAEAAAWPLQTELGIELGSVPELTGSTEDCAKARRNRIPTTYADAVPPAELAPGGSLSVVLRRSGTKQTISLSGEDGWDGKGRKEGASSAGGTFDPNDRSHGTDNGACRADSAGRKPWLDADCETLARAAFGERCDRRLLRLLAKYWATDRRLCWLVVCQAREQKKPIDTPWRWCSGLFKTLRHRDAEARLEVARETLNNPA